MYSLQFFLIAYPIAAITAVSTTVRIAAVTTKSPLITDEMIALLGDPPLSAAHGKRDMKTFS